MDEVHSDAESVSSVSVKDAPVVPANNKRKARSPPEDPVTPEAKVLLDRVKRLKVDLDDLRKKDRFDVIQSMPGRFRLSQDDPEAGAMFCTSQSKFAEDVRYFEKAIGRRIRSAGVDAGEERKIKDMAETRYANRMATLSARRDKEMAEIEKKYAEDADRAAESKNEFLESKRQSRAAVFKHDLKSVNYWWEQLSKGSRYDYEKWLKDRDQKVFLSLFKDGRVMSTDSVVCRACKSSKCVFRDCGRAHTFQFGGVPTEELKKAVSDRKRDANGAIVMFCASGDSCALTLEKLSPERAAAVLPCKHVFDKDAIQMTQKCPVCREPFCVVQEYTGDKCVGLVPVNNDV